MSCHVLIPAAGAGKRMQAGVNKQYLELRGEPILAHTLRLFQGHPAVDGIWVITPAAERDYCRSQVVEKFGFTKVREVVAGGAERQDSVRNGLLACSAVKDDLVMIHDGARPLLQPLLIDLVLEAATRSGAALIGVPVKDTIKRVVELQVKETPRRNELWQAQTPQAFRYALILQAHLEAQRQGYVGTDDASLVEWAGGEVTMVPGDDSNLKITTPQDLVLAEALLQVKENH